MASPPRVRTRSATCSAIVESFPTPDTSAPRSFTTTRAPRSARSSTYARPSPRPAPVTIATFPANEIRSVISPSTLSACLESGGRRLHARRERPGCDAADERDELAPFHSIVLSVLAGLIEMALPLVLPQKGWHTSPHLTNHCTAGFQP